MEFASPRYSTPTPALSAFKFLLPGIFLLVLAGNTAAQTVCKDEALADPWFACGTIFDPVCACDNITYRNQCAARNNGGIQGNQWISGPCQDFFVFIYPTMNLYGTLNFRMQFKERGRATLFIIDNYGRIKRQQQVEAGNSFPVQMDLDVSYLDAGIYFLLIRGDNYQQLERFVVLHL